MTSDTETLKEIYAAINRNDVPALAELLDPEIEWTEPPDFPGGGTRKGRDVVLEHFSVSRDTWAEGSCEIERLIPAGDKIVVFDYVKVRLKEKTEWIEAPIAAVYKFRNGKAFEVHIFGDRQEAIEWAGVTAEDMAG